MEFIRIGKGKLKVLLSAKELDEYGIRIEDGDCEASRIKQALGDIFEQSEKQAGFKVGRDRALVQLYPTGDGGEMFITKLSFVGDREKKAILSSEGMTVSNKKSKTYRFNSLEEAARAARAIGDEKLRSDLFYSNFGCYYLRVEELTIGALYRSDVLLEFGEEAELPLDISEEGGRLLISRNAIEMLSKI